MVVTVYMKAVYFCVNTEIGRLWSSKYFLTDFIFSKIPYIYFCLRKGKTWESSLQFNFVSAFISSVDIWGSI